MRTRFWNGFAIRCKFFLPKAEEEGPGASLALWEQLMEEKFFFLYHMHMIPPDAMQLPINERKWIIQRFIQQKDKENEAMEAARRKSR